MVDDELRARGATVEEAPLEGAAAAAAEAVVHPGLYQRRNGVVDWSTVAGTGFGYRLEEIERELPTAAARFGEA